MYEPFRFVARVEHIFQKLIVFHHAARFVLRVVLAEDHCAHATQTIRNCRDKSQSPDRITYLLTGIGAGVHERGLLNVLEHMRFCNATEGTGALRALLVTKALFFDESPGHLYYDRPFDEVMALK